MAFGTSLGKRKRDSKHPYLSGNFAAQEKTCPLTPCSYTGTIPDELVGGQYVRNGSNPVTNEDLGREAHWFDGDGMIAGVSFARSTNPQERVEPQFVNQYILTDVYLSSISTPALKKPLLPSISTLVNPVSSLLRIVWSILRSVIIVILTRLPGSKQTIKKISVANTAILYHDGRALATCESGPPMRVTLPSLDTVGWYNGQIAQGEPEKEADGPVLGGTGLMSWMKEWTTAHPKVDPVTNEMLLFHSTPRPPFVNYSVIPADRTRSGSLSGTTHLVGAAVAGVSSAKMMHDFGVSSHHTLIMDLPLSMDLKQLAKRQPVICYDALNASRFGIFPRRQPDNVRWFETSACCIFHTANTWDVAAADGSLQSVDLLACRMTSATVVFTAGNIAAPQPTKRTAAKVKRRLGLSQDTYVDHPAYAKLPRVRTDELPVEASDEERQSLLMDKEDEDEEEEEETDQCRLYYYSFDMRQGSPQNQITHQFGLSAIPFEFPSVHPEKQMSEARYVYGCSSTNSTFNSALGRAATIDAIVKFDATTLTERGKITGVKPVTGCVDTRSVHEVIDSYKTGKKANDPIQIFHCPPNIYAGEPRFVPAANARHEDDGYLVCYMFDEQQLDAEGEVTADSRSELWVIDARSMTDVVAKVQLPQRVPYGLHGHWFSEREVMGQRAVESVRRIVEEDDQSRKAKIGRWVIDKAINAIGG